jgi:hypothetical protein
VRRENAPKTAQPIFLSIDVRIRVILNFGKGDRIQIVCLFLDRKCDPKKGPCQQAKNPI